jgi:hypothetical protein
MLTQDLEFSVASNPFSVRLQNVDGSTMEQCCQLLGVPNFSIGVMDICILTRFGGPILKIKVLLIASCCLVSQVLIPQLIILLFRQALALSTPTGAQIKRASLSPA